MDSSRFLIIGANGQLGTALKEKYPDAQAADVDELDITNKESVEEYDWSAVDVILNAAAYTDVDGAETAEGKIAAQKVNAEAVQNLVDVAKQDDLTLVHVSTAYVFDGKKKIYTEEDDMNPLGEYAKSKAAGDKAVMQLEKYYIVRTDSVIGEGKNFVRTMLGLAEKGIDPSVVADQFIRPTFTSEIVKAIGHLLSNKCEFGTYNVTNDGETVSWADFTRAIFAEAGVDRKVTDTTLAEYSSSKPGIAPRPLNSVLDLSKIKSTGYKTTDWKEDLKKYVEKEVKK